MMRTWQTRPTVTVKDSPILDAYAKLYGTVERCLFAERAAGKKSIAQLKREYLPRFKITGRQFNAIRIGLDGKISSIQQLRPTLIKESAQRIEKAEKELKKLRAKTGGTPEQQTKRANKIHQKERRLAALRLKHAAMVADQKAGKVRLCFGSRKQFRAQFNLEDNGYADHAEWRKDWQTARSSEFTLVGSKGETAGNQSCQLQVNASGEFSLKLRLPNAIGKWLELPITLPHGIEPILKALTLNQSLTYRFVRDDRGWRVFIITDLVERPLVTSRQVGTIGVDINVDHLAVAEMDRDGNIIDTERIPLCTYGKSPAQAKAIVGDACKRVIQRATESKKPIALEKLDFAKKKAELECAAPRTSRMLSSFAYSQIRQTLNARAFDAGVEVISVNPAYTSVIGRHKFAKRYGISNHQAAAAAIGRRAVHFSELPNRCFSDQVTFALPVRNRAKHVWAYWREVAKKEAAHVAQSRLAKRQSKPAGTSPDLGPIRDLSAKSRHASRSQHYSGNADGISAPG